MYMAILVCYYYNANGKKSQRKEVHMKLHFFGTVSGMWQLPDRNRTRVPCIGCWIFIHCATREVWNKCFDGY